MTEAPAQLTAAIAALWQGPPVDLGEDLRTRRCSANWWKSARSISPRPPVPQASPETLISRVWAGHLSTHYVPLARRGLLKMALHHSLQRLRESVR